MAKEQRKQIILCIVAFILIGIGCFNFNTKDIIEVASKEARNEENLGDVEFVSATPENAQNMVSNALVSNDENNTAEENIVIVDEKTNEYFVETKLERDRMYSEMLETYQKMLNSTDTIESQKAIAMQEITNITNLKNGIMISENLIKNKNFENVVILVNNGTASVIIKSSLLTQEQIAQIQNIVSRELNIEVSKINITNK